MMLILKTIPTSNMDKEATDIATAIIMAMAMARRKMPRNTFIITTMNTRRKNNLQNKKSQQMTLFVFYKPSNIIFFLAKHIHELKTTLIQ